MSPQTLHQVPLTIEGSWVLHQMFRFDAGAWAKYETARKRFLMREMMALLYKWEQEAEFPTAAFSMIGHKCDLMLVHFRKDAVQLHMAEREINRLSIGSVLHLSHSYLSVVELGLYESSVKTFKSLQEKGVQPHTEEWNQAIADTLQRQSDAMAPRLYPTFPDKRYICFYPMDRLRGEDKNWYSAPIEERQRMMHEHGLVGRRYADDVKQIISGSIGLDDWEWAVDLFSDDPLVFKRLIYEMRFDEVSAVYAKFGQFFVGLRVPAEYLEEFLIG
jgi:chlorite dismutase